MKLPLVMLLTSMLIFIWVTSVAKTLPEGVIIPGHRVGYIKAQTTETDLINDFGKQNVVSMLVDIGECEMQEATVLYPQDSLRTLQIFWQDTQSHSKPMMIRINSKNTVWKTTDGISIGTSLLEIEKLNEAPFWLAGFQWDYEGTIIHCGDGKLCCLGVDSSGAEELSPRTLLLRLRPDWDTAYRFYPDVLDKVAGDGWFSSSDPAMQKINPRVYEMYVYFTENMLE